MFAPKAVGAWNIHCASAAVPLEAEVLFSSVGAGLGNVGQTNYAAGNACLDSHALSRRAHGMVGCSLQWPLVGGAGMGAAAFSALGERRASIAGLAGISLAQYAACLGSQLSAHHGAALGVQLVHRSDVQGLLQDLADASQPRFSELRAATKGSSAAVAASETAADVSVADTALGRALATMVPSQRQGHAEAEVLRVVRELTGTAPAELRAETPLMEAGVDSLAATELSSRLRSLTGMALSPTLIFEQPTARAVAAHLVEEAMGGEDVGVMATVPTGAALDSSVALAGMVGRWPGGVCDEVLRWQLQRACGDALGEVPAALPSSAEGP